MKTESFSFSYQIFSEKSELPSDLQQLLQLAEEARQRAYAPYSSFQVGAAALLDNGKIITGNNQENVAFPSGMCAERVAIFYAMAQFPDAKILKIAISGVNTIVPKKEAVTPCGSCRQAILEYEMKQKNAIEILCSGADGDILVFRSVRELLPFCFDSLSH